MGIATNQQITNYYEKYCDTEVVFSREVMNVLRVNPRQIYIKCNGDQWPCIINSTSFKMAKIILGRKGGAFQQITDISSPTVNLRFCFSEEQNKMLSFFISGKVTDVIPYSKNADDPVIVTITFTQRVPDDFILKFGTLIEANANFLKRKEERIPFTAETKQKLGIFGTEPIIFVENIPRKCVLRDISFSGARILLLGHPQFAKNKNIVLRLQFTDPIETIDICGNVRTVDTIEGRNDIISAGIQFDETKVPISYKLRINSYLVTTRKNFLETPDAPLHASDDTSDVQTHIGNN